MANRKIKLEHPKFKYNRLGNIRGYVSHGDEIRSLFIRQDRKNNGLDLDGTIHPDVLNPGKWTLHFDGTDFWLEGSKKFIDRYESDMSLAKAFEV